MLPLTLRTILIAVVSQSVDLIAVGLQRALFTSLAVPGGLDRIRVRTISFGASWLATASILVGVPSLLSQIDAIL
jgi:hypothetical protein